MCHWTGNIQYYILNPTVFLNWSKNEVNCCKSNIQHKPNCVIEKINTSAAIAAVCTTSYSHIPVRGLPQLLDQHRKLGERERGRLALSVIYCKSFVKPEYFFMWY